jgi:putative iron-regulated protein
MRILPRLVLLFPALGTLIAQSTAPAADPLARVVQRHAEYVGALHREALAAAERMQQAIADMLAAPDEAHLRAARAAWIEARHPYSRLEVLRGQDGPIDRIEPLLNAWPVDEAYIDHVIGRPDTGIVHDRARFPLLEATVLEHANERGGECNVAVGWHAIEFLLWGQDRDPSGPGQRPASDYVVGGERDAERRRVYLAQITARLVAHLRALAAAWAPDADNHRRAFEREPRASLRRMLAGAMLMTTFELAGERLAVAYETRDQEQEHSCFSDNTLADLLDNQLGVMAVFDGGPGAPVGSDLTSLLREQRPELATLVTTRLQATLAALRAIPAPFDQAFLGADDAPGRVAMRVALDALDAQSEAIAIVGQHFGYELPVRPGGGLGGR